MITYSNTEWPAFQKLALDWMKNGATKHGVEFEIEEQPNIVGSTRYPASFNLKAHGCEAVGVCATDDATGHIVFRIHAFGVAPKGRIASAQTGDTLAYKFLVSAQQEARIDRQRIAIKACEDGAKSFIKHHVDVARGYQVDPIITAPIKGEPSWDGFVVIGIARNPHYASTSAPLPGLEKVHYTRANNFFKLLKQVTL